MTALAIANRNGGPPAAAQAAPDRYDPTQLWEVAGWVHASGLFKVASQNQAFTMMLLCQAKGLNAIEAIERYHVVDGRPAMRADAMQAEFEKHGGRIKVERHDAKEIRGTFYHPELAPEGRPVSLTLAQFEKVGLTSKANWKNYPESMLWARFITTGVRRTYPGIIMGVYTPEEIEDMAYLETAPARHAALDSQAKDAVAAAEVPVWGFAGTGFDDRAYHQVVSDAAGALNRRVEEAWAAAFGGDRAGAPKSLSNGEAHGHLMNWAIQQGLSARPASQKGSEVIKALARVYGSHRDRVRAELTTLVEGLAAKAEAAIAGRQDLLAAALAQGEPGDAEEQEAGTRG